MGKNREKVLTPKSDKSWYCYHCDCGVVNDGQRCSHCGCKNSRYRLKVNKNNSKLIESFEVDIE